MNVSECDQLDDYLAGWLPEDEAAAFQTHLSGCPACREEFERQKQIDHLLVRGVRQLEPVPSSLIDRVERQFRLSSRRRAVRLACGLSAAAVFVLALGVWFAMGQIGTRREPRPIAHKRLGPAAGGGQVDPSARETPPAGPAVRVTFHDPSDAILVPLETAAPNVSIVWIYPTVKPVPAPNGPAND